MDGAKPGADTSGYSLEGCIGRRALWSGGSWAVKSSGPVTSEDPGGSNSKEE